MSFFLPLTSINAYLHGIAIANIYNLVYFRAFERAVAEQQVEYIVESQKMYSKNGREARSTINIFETFYSSWLRNVDDELKNELKSDSFAELLSKYIQDLLNLRSEFKKAGYPMDYLDRLFELFKQGQSAFFFQTAKESNLAPFDVAYRKDKSRLLHYRYEDKAEGSNFGADSDTKKKVRKRQPQPLLIIYAPINTFHILDLNPRKSVVRNLLSPGGLDIYLLDWGYPDSTDDHLSVEDYLRYIDDSVKIIKEQTGADKVSLMGYCWGGIFALIYSSLNNDNVRNLVLMAVPVDFSKDDTILTKWSKAVDIDRMMNELGRMDGQMLDLAFLMRNPPRYGFDKYMKSFQKMFDNEFVQTFIDVERWLYDTPPIPGALHRQIITDCYINNLLVSHRMQVGGKNTATGGGSKQQSTILAAVDLSKITMPVLTIIAEKDDLVSRASSLAINDHTSSKDKSVFQYPGGHVALCISDTAHKKLWPDVARWFLSR